MSNRRVLVTASRRWKNRGLLNMILNEEHARDPISCIIHGDALGGDTMADEWAQAHDIATDPYPASWHLGKSAGPIRNSYMLANSNPTDALAFHLVPITPGTKDMCGKIKRCGLPLRYIPDTYASDLQRQRIMDMDNL